MSKKGWAIGVVAFLAIVGSCSDEETTSTTAPAPVAAPASSSPYVAPVAAPTTSAAPAGVAVTRVIDGDTFEIAGGQRVRVLGIDSCEIGTYGGTQAKQSAEIALDGESVVLEQEPGVDRDRYGRLLRYVSTGYGSDFGESMVVQTHTGAARGDSDASDARLADLRERDYGGRDCSQPDDTPRTTEYDVDVDVDDDVNLPDGALTGGYCARKWWC
ncbi:thermonuclease family protein [Actinomycetospora sp. NBC_00405]|uniref:thermonuclease family protein n=1 Tax=Actinomycetospora sp. NBC_00405 TaxID=2975952 RepID=UPI002E1B0F71